MFSLLTNGRLSDLLKPLVGFVGFWIDCARFRIESSSLILVFEQSFYCGYKRIRFEWLL
jgi:hypothetical protein